jgi:uncharacterized protein YjdB
MNNRLKTRLIALLFVLTFVFSVPLTANAEEASQTEPITQVEETTEPSTQSPTEVTTSVPEETTQPTTAKPTPTEPVPTEPKKQYSGSAGTNLNYSFNKNTGTLTFKGDGTKMKTYSVASPAPWHTFASEIKVVNLKPATKLKNIGSYAFLDLVNLKSVKYPDTVKIFGVGSFVKTKSLKTLKISKNVSLIKSSAFKGSGVTLLQFMNRYTKIAGGASTIPKAAVIKCYSPSYAAKYATKYKRKTQFFVTVIAASEKKSVICKGKKYTVEVTKEPSNAFNKKIKWVTSNKKIATVSQKGVVTAKKQGTCYVYAKSVDGGNVTSTKCKIIVTNFQLNEYMFTKNNCYKEQTAIDPKGIVVHSTGANNPNVSAYVPSWNTAKPGGREVCVHGFVGKDSKGKMVAYQVLPFEMACWGVGRGSKGSYNYYPGYIQFECCEDGLTNKNYFNKVYNTATDYCAYLCLKYSLPVSSIVSHAEACKKGYGSNHGDIDHWLKRFGLTMKDFRKTVKTKIYAIDPSPDLKSGTKHKKVTVLKTTNIYSKDFVDEYGTGSKKLQKVSAGDKITFIKDEFNGWSEVRTSKGKKGYVLNSKIDLDYGSKLSSERIGLYGVNYYSRPTASDKYKEGTFPYYAKVKVISYITKGSKKGWAWVVYKNKKYYVKSKYFK